MHVRRIAASALALAAVGLAGTAVAKNKNLNVETLRRDAYGQVTGVILCDGTELVGDANKNDLKRVAIPGDPVRVTVDGKERFVLVNGRTFDTVEIGDQARSALRPNIDKPIGIGGGPIATDASNARIDDASMLNRYQVFGRVALVLKTKAGAPSGLLMDDGTQVQVVPRFSGALTDLKPGTQVWVEGRGTRNENGLAMWAMSIRQGDYYYLDVERGGGAPEINITGPFPTR